MEVIKCGAINPFASALPSADCGDDRHCRHGLLAARASRRTAERLGLLPRSWPLAFYRRRSFYVMRTDAFDRFCTRLEQRFTRAQITDMLRAADFDDIRFSEQEPFWVAVATKQR